MNQFLQTQHKYFCAVIFMLSPWLGGGCATVKSQQSSGLKYSYVDGDLLGGTPLALLMAKDAKIIKDGGTTLMVCIERMGDKIDADDMMIEAKLTYFYWLTAAKRADIYARLKFVLKEQCMNEADPADVVLGYALPEDHKKSPIRVPIKYPTATCERKSDSLECSSSVVLGQGAPAAIGFATESNKPNKWLELEIHVPAASWFNRGVQWTSLRSAINDDTKLSADDKKKLTTALDAIKTKDTVESLQTLVGLLEASKLIDEKSTDLDQVVEKLQADPKFTKGETSFVMQATWFHTALHEVGHQFGLMHPDNIKDEWKTGASSLTKEKDGKHTTEQAVMAYELPYLYLTEDDKKGAIDVLNLTEKIMQSHLE
jgi:hypothetical protein